VNPRRNMVLVKNKNGTRLFNLFKIYNKMKKHDKQEDVQR
jgi:hypothetical protein